MSSYEIKIADSETDKNILAALIMELDLIHHNAAPERFPLFSLEQRKHFISQTIDNGYVFYIQNDSEIIGLATVVKKTENRFLIEQIFLKKIFRSQGLGKKLIKKIFCYLQKGEVFASVYSFNTEAINFYSNLFELSSIVFRKKL